MGQTPSVIDPSTRQYYEVNCCSIDPNSVEARGPMSAAYQDKNFSNAEIQNFHPFVVQYMKLLSENLNQNFFEEFASNTTIEKYQTLEPELKEAAHFLSQGLNILFKKGKIQQSGLNTLMNPRFADALGGLLVTTISESTKQVVALAEAQKIAPREERADTPLFCSPRDYFYLDSVKMTEKYIATPYQRLREFKPFVLDNSIRESTVAQQRGHVKSDKYAILHAVEEVGIENIIIAAFGELPQVEDDWLEELHREGKMKPNFWAFSEFSQSYEGGKPSAQMPIGLEKIIRYQVPNAIFEMDIGALHEVWYKGGWTTTEQCDLMKARILTLQKHVGAKSKTFFNFRDAVKVYAYPAMARVMVELTVYLAKLPVGLRPMGILFEEPAGDAFPWQVRSLVRMLRKAMNDNGWVDGHLLIHVHKNYGMCEAVIQESLAYGCTGIWGGISEEGK